MAMTDPDGVRAAFLDKDGTLVHDVPRNADPHRLELLPRVGAGLRALQDAGYLLVVVSNQPGVAPGHFPAGVLGDVEARLDALLEPFGVVITAYAWCTHRPAGVRAAGGPCACRKPKPGLLLEAAAAHGIALARSWMIGDILDDVQAGHAAGCRSVLLDVGHETQWMPGPLRSPDLVERDLEAAARAILLRDALDARRAA